GDPLALGVHQQPVAVEDHGGGRPARGPLVQRRGEKGGGLEAHADQGIHPRLHECSESRRPSLCDALGAQAEAAARPCSMSARMSSMCSMPTLRRTKPGSMPAARCSCSLSCEWVVEAGWMTRLRTSPMFATCEWSV